ncbi:DUF11 domain-containing protein [Sphingomonas crocodyli]|uniref:DUF11 domain-containing protein n=1 Tax=Sphingomonas crocodyli TaxID=1979270 RepID=A0A437M5Q5_9SPHN|nr:DUF11 domain-containing protein [Sphingomonas crocodyli]RVT93070.1 DUF11 domain-containing protein [Sphingomonas crocodyli]
MLRKFINPLLLSGSALALAMPGIAHAAGTVAGTTVTNTATVNFSVGGTAQSPVSSNAANFLVDRKVNVTVSEVGGAATTVTFGSTNQVTTFAVTNNTNSVMDYRLFATEQLALVSTIFGHQDNYTVSNIRVFVDSNGNGIYDAGVDTGTFVDELAPDASVAVFIVADIPATGPSNAVAGISLTAVAATGGTGGALGADTIASLLGDNPGAVDNVFADGQGAIDAVRDGRFSAFDEYVVGTAAVTAIKTATTIMDPVNGSLLPKAIPGATVEYCIQVTNAGPGTAQDVVVEDAIPANSTYVPGSLYVGGSTLLGACVADGSFEDDDTSGADDADGTTGSFDNTKIHSLIATVPALSTVTTRFRVTVN